MPKLPVRKQPSEPLFTKRLKLVRQSMRIKQPCLPLQRTPQSIASRYMLPRLARRLTSAATFWRLRRHTKRAKW